MAENELSAEESSLELPDSMFRTGEGDPRQAMITMYRVSQDPEPEVEHADNTGLVNVTVDYTEIDGDAVFEGDIVLGTLDELTNPPDPTRGLVITGNQFRWRNGIVPFVAQPAVRAKAEAAIAHWQQKTPFRFPLRTTEPDFISFEKPTNPDVCNSRVGRQGGKQVINLGGNCSVGSAIHEIAHALGAWHEQSREDRDNFVRIVFANIRPDAAHNFAKRILDGTDLGGYDYRSIMHYPRKAFSVNGQDTIIPTQPDAVIGQRDGLSTRDIAAFKMAYPTLNWP